MFQKVTKNKTPLHFCLLQASYYFFNFKMSVEESFVEKLQRQSREKVQKLKEEQERQREQQRFVNILPLQSKSLEKGLPFPSFIYSSSFQRFSLTSKFEKAFEEIRKNNRDCKETLRNYSFKKPRREAGPSEQVDPISIFYYEEEKQKDDLQQEQEEPLHQEEPTQDQIAEKVHIRNKKCTKRTN